MVSLPLRQLGSYDGVWEAVRESRQNQSQWRRSSQDRARCRCRSLQLRSRVGLRGAVARSFEEASLTRFPQVRDRDRAVRRVKASDPSDDNIARDHNADLITDREGAMATALGVLVIVFIVIVIFVIITVWALALNGCPSEWRWTWSIQIMVVRVMQHGSTRIPTTAPAWNPALAATSATISMIGRLS